MNVPSCLINFIVQTGGKRKTHDMSRYDFLTLASVLQLVMYRVKVATNSSRIWHNHFRKLMTSFFYPCKNKLNSLLVIKSLNCLISLNWLNLCYYICKNATHVVNNYDWFLSIYKRSLSTKLLGRTYTFFYHFNFNPENFITTMAYTYDIRENFVGLSFHFQQTFLQ